MVKEIAEEANMAVQADKLYAVHHKAKHPYRQDVRDFYKFFFVCSATDDGIAAAGAECLDVGYFPLSELPPLSEGRILQKDIEAAFVHRDNAGLATFFD